MNTDPASNAIATYLTPQDVLLDLDVADKPALFTAIGRHLHDEHGVPQHVIAQGLARREQAMSTGLGGGFAIPHARIEGLARTHVIYARLHTPMPYGARDGKPVTDILALLVPSPGTDEHLRLLADATRLFSDAEFRERLRSSTDPLEVFHLFSARPDAASAQAQVGEARPDQTAVRPRTT